MKTRYISVALLFILVLAVVLLTRAAGLDPPSDATHRTSSPEVESAFVDHAETRGDGSTSIPAAAQTVAPQATPSLDGPALLERYCSPCHVTKFIERTEKSLIEWEDTLAQMEKAGVRLENSEKAVLLKYLASTN